MIVTQPNNTFRAIAMPDRQIFSRRSVPPRPFRPRVWLSESKTLQYNGLAKWLYARRSSQNGNLKVNIWLARFE